ncbi:MAG: tetratricopeptide repeat protein [Thermoanaerobaculia bacterium]|nr:tetratricopeptide repeat protein [Thermoanaerobaculia bacterium]
MRRIHSGVLAAAVLVSFLSGCGPQVTVMHTIPAVYNLGLIERVVLVEAWGSSFEVPAVVSAMAGESYARGFYQFVDARSARMAIRVLKSADAEREAEKFRNEWKADVYIGLELLGCRVKPNSRVVTEKDKDGKEYQVTKYWHEGSCEVKVDLVNARDGREIASFGVVSSEETSPMNTESSYDAEQALKRALESAGVQAVARFTPRRASQSIFLEKDAPLGKEGGQLVSDHRLPEARKFWEDALSSYQEVASYNYNLGAVCDALGDSAAARRYYEKAVRLAPDSDRYRNALSSLEQREADARALRQRK